MKTFKANSHVSQREVEMGQVRVRVTLLYLLGRLLLPCVPACFLIYILKESKYYGLYKRVLKANFTA